MAVGQNVDVSKKLKAAIKAKLEELGVYVDDELPEYIMVMIANKKEKNQMKDDLNLFLGKCTNKFVDWLFDLFERLQTAGSKSDSHSAVDKATKENSKEHSKNKERKKEAEVVPHTSTSKKEDKKVRSTRRQKDRRSRSRSKTWSDDEFEQHVEERNKKVASSVIAQRPLAASPEPVKVSSQVHVMRKVKTATSEMEVKTMKAGSSMFLKAMNQASVSAGYGASLIDKKKSVLPGPVSRSPLKSRLTRPDVEIDSDGENAYKAEVILTEKSRARPISPQITVTLKGAKDHIVVKKANLKRRKEKTDVDARNASVVVVPEKRGRTVELDDEIGDGYESPSVRKWDGQIQLDEEDTTDDDEAKIDAVLADARVVTSTMDEDDEVPPTHQLSRGNSWSGYAGSPSQQPLGAPNYVPTPLSKDEVNFTTVTKIPERCRFWPTCRQGENCPYTHPNKQCINFPHCSFGARCLYIHPPCRFDRKCANPNCPYTHGRIAAATTPVPVTTSAAVAPQISQPIATSSPISAVSDATKISPDVPLSTETKTSLSITPCLFGNKCKKPNCAFKHPKACHYGVLCMNASCYFYHPPQLKSTPNTSATVTKYKWKASSATA
ncbi:hypothetical protein DICVIV_04228 [Dictyocaulus viviparus]|uniref:Zinc finger CCCH domain-containing protein 14 n=1 Tax=Dictyocaulus viviparus TaxID=29172 RepID=A0A0D8XY74_DICVI|nr:hypothetical protein DICVIV_04228 [Dictyocaulus viviparus]